MIEPWVELDVELFKEIFYAYLNHEGNSAKKVIEIQNISNISLGASPSEETRIFLGAGLDPFEWREDNEMVCLMYEKFVEAGMGDKMKDDLSILNICYFQEGSPLISPIGATKNNTELFLDTCFGDMEDIEKNPLYSTIKDLDQTVVWYKRNKKGKIDYVTTRPKVSDRDKLVRIRAMDLEDWKHMMLEGTTIGRFPNKYKTDDIKKKDIIREDGY